MGAGTPRDLNVPGRGYENIHFAMDYLTQQNRLNAGEPLSARVISAKDRTVVVIGGGDTGSDCVGTARRQGAREIFQLEILPKPPDTRPPDTPWPNWPRIMRTSTSHEEGCHRRWSVMTRRFLGSETHVTGLDCIEVEWFNKDGQWKLRELPGAEFELKADSSCWRRIVHVEHGDLTGNRLKLDARGTS